MSMLMLINLGITVALLVGIVWACMIFTNGIEWVGHRFSISQGAVGSVLAAVGTALPETLVPALALIKSAFFSTSSTTSADVTHIGIGAILGAPFLLSTLAMGLMGLAVLYFARLKKRGRVLHLNLYLVKRDLLYFLPAYALVFAAGLLPASPLKPALAIGLLAFYGLYVYRTFQIDVGSTAEPDLEPLIFAPKTDQPTTGLILLQVFVGLLAILGLADLFVDRIQDLSHLWGVSPLLLSLIITPIATEMPEKFNSMLWISKKKDGLAMGNVTGAMVFQSCIPTAIGLAFTPWILQGQGVLSILLCFFSIGVLFLGIVLRGLVLPSMLLVGGVVYLVFLATCLFQIWGGA